MDALTDHQCRLPPANRILMPLLTELGNPPGWTHYKDAAPTALPISQGDFIIQPGVADGIGYAG